MNRSTSMLGAAVRRGVSGLRAMMVTALLLPVLTVQAQTASSTALTVSPNPSTYAQNVTLTATVTGTSPGGIVTFMDGAATVGTGTLSAGVATLGVSTLTVGSHSLTAAYGGDAGNAASTSSALTQTVNQAATTTALTSSMNPSAYAQTVTLTATVSGAGSPGGIVTFKDGSAVLGTVTLAGSGNTRTAIFAISTLTGGSHSMTAVYAGDGNNNTSTSTGLTQTINKLATTTTVGSNLNPSTYGQTVTWAATVSDTNATGSVTFKDGTTVLGTATVMAGTASFSASALARGDPQHPRRLCGRQQLRHQHLGRADPDG
jgi:hypothetical protein